MKKILSLVVVALIAVGYAHASTVAPESPVGMSVVKSGDVFKLFYRGEKAGTVKVTIYNAKGQTVFSEVMRKTEHFMRPYNFASLPAGVYVIEISDEDGVRSRKVNHFPSAYKGNTTFAHLTRLRDAGKYMLAVPYRGSDALTVKIYNERNQLLYIETETVNGNFAKLYDLSKVGGNHTFEISDDQGHVNRLSKPLQK